MLRYHWLVAMFALLAGVYLTTIACDAAADGNPRDRSQRFDAINQTGDGAGDENEGE